MVVRHAEGSLMATAWLQPTARTSHRLVVSYAPYTRFSATSCQQPLDGVEVTLCCHLAVVKCPVDWQLHQIKDIGSSAVGVHMQSVILAFVNIASSLN